MYVNEIKFFDNSKELVCVKNDAFDRFYDASKLYNVKPASMIVEFTASDNSPQSVWTSNKLTIAHLMNCYPIVQVYDNDNEQVYPTVKILNGNSFELDFADAGKPPSGERWKCSIIYGTEYGSSGNISTDVGSALAAIQEMYDAIIGHGGGEDESSSSSPSGGSSSSGGEQPSGSYIPLSDKGVANGVAELDSNAKVPVARLPYGTNTSAGIVKGDSAQAYGIGIESDGTVKTAKATTSEIDAKSNDHKVISPSNLDYAVRSVLDNSVTIPSSTTAYMLLDSSSSINNHCHTYTHIPLHPSTYTLPGVSDTLLHEIVLEVKFDAYERYSSGDDEGCYAWKSGSSIIYTDSQFPVAGTTVAYSDTSLSSDIETIAVYDSLSNAVSLVGSCEFETSNGDTIVPTTTPSIGVGSVISYLCRWSLTLGEWCILPIPLR